MKTDELREKYLEFFVQQGHSRQPSDVLVPTWDPSVLFTPAGMNQFKDHFLGKVKLDFTRATTCQKCLRTGDIDNVGRTAYHHTFFEMLGNFSFGDYFKAEAILWAWQFLTDKKWLGIDPARLTVTVYKDDDEAAGIWHEKIGLPASRISRMDEDENFWPASAPSQGPDGVCGPCSEIYYQLDNGKDVEIWNLVFTQFNRVGEPPNNLRPLPSKNIDTGMGLERTASVMQNVPTNFHIDILFPIVKAAAEVCSRSYVYDSEDGRRLRRITDHIRACVFSVHENILPGPKKARYVIKRLLRRAVLDGHQMGMRQPFLYQLVPAVAQAMGGAYPELKTTVQRVAEVIRKEEGDFFSTIDAGLDRIAKVFSHMEQSRMLMVDGDEAATLYQTYGVPPELFQTMAADRSFTFDWSGFRQAMKKHEEISGGGQRELFQTGPLETLKAALHRTEFVGYETNSSPVVVQGIIVGDGADERLASQIDASQCTDQRLQVVVDRTPFYAEGGGQVGDRGRLQADGVEFLVTDTQRSGELIVHLGRLTKGRLSTGQQLSAQVDDARRSGIQRAHSATHILHHALQSVLGGHAQQQGSKVDDDWLRFDFTNLVALTDQQVQQIESIVTDRVRAAEPISWKTVPLTEARQAGAMMLFGEKYPDPVRMVSMGDFSKELCGGTHLQNTQQVQNFEVMSEEGIAAGTRRIEALTGEKAAARRSEVQQVLQRIADELSCATGDVVEAIKCLSLNVRGLKKQLDGGAECQLQSLSSSAGSASDYPQQRRLLRDASRMLNVASDKLLARVQSLRADQQKLQSQIAELASEGELSVASLLDRGQMVGDTLVLVTETVGANPNLMRRWIDQIRTQSAQPAAVLLAAKSGDDKVMLVAGLSKSLVGKGVSANDWIGQVAPIVGGGGGGKPDFAQAGGKQPDKLPQALEAARQAIGKLLKGI
ncbi:MAG: alanine--tRNA ligase [Pirellulaceae bacterium]|nr:alanine--tRNA ligase [Pirellulaceae bacterium]